MASDKCHLCSRLTHRNGNSIFGKYVCSLCFDHWQSSASDRAALESLRANQERIVLSLQLQLAKMDQVFEAEVGEQLKKLSADQICDLLEKTELAGPVYAILNNWIKRDLRPLPYYPQYYEDQQALQQLQRRYAPREFEVTRDRSGAPTARSEYRNYLDIPPAKTDKP